jgi:hypothetical protein
MNRSVEPGDVGTIFLNTIPAGLSIRCETALLHSK